MGEEITYTVPTLHDAVEKTVSGPQVNKMLDWGKRNVEYLRYAEVVIEQYGVPVDASKITTIEFVPNESHLQGMASAVACGEYTYKFIPCNNSKWITEKTPESYIIWVAKNSSKPLNTIRHELAHIVNWEQHGYTVENRGIHKEWLDQLNAE